MSEETEIRKDEEVTKEATLLAMSMVFQNVYLFNDTIRANICFGRDGKHDEMLLFCYKSSDIINSKDEFLPK